MGGKSLGGTCGPASGPPACACRGCEASLLRRKLLPLTMTRCVPATQLEVRLFSYSSQGRWVQRKRGGPAREPHRWRAQNKWRQVHRANECAVLASATRVEGDLFVKRGSAHANPRMYWE